LNCFFNQNGEKVKGFEGEAYMIHKYKAKNFNYLEFDLLDPANMVFSQKALNEGESPFIERKSLILRADEEIKLKIKEDKINKAKAEEKKLPNSPANRVKKSVKSKPRKNRK
jgi:hypothetical protein